MIGYRAELLADVDAAPPTNLSVIFAGNVAGAVFLTDRMARPSNCVRQRGTWPWSP
jgi:hypothetical protein